MRLPTQSVAICLGHPKTRLRRRQGHRRWRPKCAPSGNQTRVWSVAGTYTITVLTAPHTLPTPRHSPYRVLSRRDYPLDHSSPGCRAAWMPSRLDPHDASAGFRGLRARAAGPDGRPKCVHSTRAVFHPSKVKLCVRVLIDALVLHRNTSLNGASMGIVVFGELGSVQSTLKDKKTFHCGDRTH